MLQRANVFRSHDQAVQVVPLFLVAATVEIGSQHPPVEENGAVLFVNQRDALQVTDQSAIDPEPQATVLNAGIREPGVILNTVPLARPNLVGRIHVIGRAIRHPADLAQHLSITAVAPLLSRGGDAHERIGCLPEVEIDGEIGIGWNVVQTGVEKGVVRPVAFWPFPTLGKEAIVAAVDLAHTRKAAVHPTACVSVGVADPQASPAGVRFHLRHAGNG